MATLYSLSSQPQLEAPPVPLLALSAMQHESFAMVENRRHSFRIFMQRPFKKPTQGRSQSNYGQREMS